MNEPLTGVDFLQKKYGLNTDPGVVSSAKKRKGISELPEYDYQTRIQRYLDRLSRLISPPQLEGHPDFDRAQRNLQMLKHSLYDQIIIKPEQVPESYFESVIQRQAEEGRPIEYIPDDIKKDLTDTAIKDQRESLDTWIDYLSSPDAKYPDWFKYYTLRSVVGMGRYDKRKMKFAERSKSGKSMSQFPELIRDALSFVCDAVVAKQTGSIINLKYGYGIKPEEKIEFEQLLKEGDLNFSKLYAWAIDKITPISEEQLQQTEGQWVKYPKGSDAKKVAKALAQYGTGWCIRGEETARRYLVSNDLEIYYSQDTDGKPTIPRIVIVTGYGERIDEVRGIAEQEHWDPYITDVIEKKLTELPDGLKFKKRVEDMQRMTAIHRKSFSVDKKTGVKTYLNPTLTQDELRFLYQIDGEIEGFGYKIPDPRITELLAKRNANEDISIIFGCEQSQIARNPNEIDEHTRVYIGPQVGVFGLLSKYKIEHIYFSFPKGEVRLYNIEIGGKSAEQLEQEINKIGRITDEAKEIIYSHDFETLKVPISLRIVRMKVRDLGFNGFTTADEIFKRAYELGLNLCPAEVGPYLRLNDKDQLKIGLFGSCYYIGINFEGSPALFGLGHDNDGLYLHRNPIKGSHHFSRNNEFVFSLPKKS